MNGRVFLTVSVVIFLFANVGIEGVEITLTDNQYNGVVIAISDVIQEQWALVDKIKDHMTEGSESLFKSTKYRTYFHNITIMVPRSWDITGRPEVKPAFDETFDGANIRIDVPHPRLPDNPYVLSYGICGRQGLYMHLTPNYIIDPSRFGPTGKTIVHEWGHLRYGLADEYGIANNPTYPLFYYDSGIQPTRCGINMEGWLLGSGCNNIGSNNLPPNDGSCRFRANRTQSDQTASMMFWQFLDNVHDFCDNDPSSPGTLHNNVAPNKQNARCNHRSCWEVMRDHQDFMSSHSTPITNPSAQSTTPIFNIVQAKPPRFVLVLDTSGSMHTTLSGTTFTRLEWLIVQSRNFINNLVPDGAFVGVATFNGVASERHAIVEINDASRISLSNSVSFSPVGSTCIGCGLQKGCQMLADFGDPAGGVLLVMSDGMENASPTIDDVRGSLFIKSVVVYTLLITDAADDMLTLLASESSGSSFFYSGMADDTGVALFFARVLGQTASGGGALSGSDRVTVSVQSLSVPANGNVSTYFTMDDTIGLDTVVSVTHEGETPQFKVRVTGPNGEIYTSDDSLITRSSTNLLELHLPGTIEAGQWEITLYNSTSSSMAEVLIISSKRIPSGATFIVEGSIGNQHINNTSVETLSQRITGGLFFGYAPILNATVEMTVRRNDQTWQKKLYDNGIGADVESEDGFYSSYFLSFTDDGQYSVTITASAGDNLAFYYETTYSSGSDRADLLPGVTETSMRRYVGAFSRLVSAGTFLVSLSGAASEDLLPPSRVNDLAVTSISAAQSTITLTWTAVGDDLDEGQASLYELRYCSTIREALDAFTDCGVITEAGSSSQFFPSPALIKEQFIWRVPLNLHNISLVIGLRVKDDEDLWSEVSNLVTVTMQNEVVNEYPVIVSTTESFDQTTQSNEQKTSSSATTSTTTSLPDAIFNTDLVPIIVPSAMAFLIIVSLLLVYRCLKYKHTRRRFEEKRWRDDVEGLGYDNYGYMPSRGSGRMMFTPKWSPKRYRPYDYWMRQNEEVYDRAPREYEDTYNYMHDRPSFYREWY